MPVIHSIMHVIIWLFGQLTHRSHFKIKLSTLCQYTSFNELSFVKVALTSHSTMHNHILVTWILNNTNSQFFQWQSRSWGGWSRLVAIQQQPPPCVQLQRTTTTQPAKQRKHYNSVNRNNSYTNDTKRNNKLFTIAILNFITMLSVFAMTLYTCLEVLQKTYHRHH